MVPAPIAAGIQKRVQEQLGLGAQDHLDTQPAAPAPEAVSPADGIDPRHIVLIRGQSAVHRLGLLSWRTSAACRVWGSRLPTRSDGSAKARCFPLAPSRMWATPALGTRTRKCARISGVSPRHGLRRGFQWLALNITMVALEELVDE